jgi:5'-nucleotidase/UDP-sugar diphosphatase
MKKVVLLIYILPVLTYCQEKNLTILYTNDLHAHFDPQKISWISETKRVGGFANIATLVKEEKKKNPNTLYFDAGDYFTGPYYSTLTKGEAVIDVMNHMSVDAACIGNHEFDHSWQNIITQLNKAKFTILNGNIFLKGTDKLLWDKPYKIISKNGIRIGIIGLHGKFAFYDTISDEMIQGVDCGDEEFYLQKYINELNPKTDLLVLIIHQGIPGRQSSKGSADVSRNLQKDIDLASKVKGLDIIVTGHAHQGTPEALTSNGTIIVSTDALGMELGRLDITYDKTQDKITSFTNKLNYVFDEDIQDDQATAEAILKWKQKVEDLSSEKITTTTAALTRSYGDESTLGNMVADAMLHAFPESDFAVVNSGGLRQDIDGGDITLGELISAFPFPNTVVKLEMKGSDIRSLFEHAASLTNGILQVSRGVVLSYSESLPLSSRVRSVLINGKELDNDQTYKVLAPNFLADGGDGFLAFKKASTKKNTQLEILQVMKRYLLTSHSYTPKLEGRIVK